MGDCMLTAGTLGRERGSGLRSEGTRAGEGSGQRAPEQVRAAEHGLIEGPPTSDQ